MEAEIAIRIGLWSGARERASAPISRLPFTPVLFLGKLTRREAQRSQSSVSDQQIDHQHDQQNTADTDAPAISPPGIAETAPEEEDKYQNNQNQVHSFLR
jgi:hypothetical protein